MVHHTAWCAYNDLYSPQPADLFPDLLATIYWQDLHAVHIFCNLAKFFRGLYGQFPGRTQDNTLQLFLPWIHLL